MHAFPDGEHVVCVCMSASYVIAATNLRYLRVFSIGGLQCFHPICVPGNIINLSADYTCNILAITFVLSSSLSSGNAIRMWIFDLDHKSKLYDGHLSLTNTESHLTRIFVQNRFVFTLDSNNILRALIHEFGWNWTPILDLNQAVKKKAEDAKTDPSMIPNTIWPVYVYSNSDSNSNSSHATLSLMVIELLSLDSPIPSQTKTPQLISYPISLPLLNMTDAMNEMTNEMQVAFGSKEELILEKSLFFKLNKNRHQSQILMQHKKEFEKLYLELFQTACSTTKPMLAFDIASTKLQSQKALIACAKIAMYHNMSGLAEAVNRLLEQKRKQEKQAKQAMQAMQTNELKSNDQSEAQHKNPHTIASSSHSNPVPKKHDRQHLQNSVLHRRQSNNNAARFGKLTTLRRPTAKLQNSENTINHQMIGKKRMASMAMGISMNQNAHNINNMNNTGTDSQPPSKKRNYTKKTNPFSSNNMLVQSQRSNSLFDV
jgi:hypothetical protein